MKTKKLFLFALLAILIAPTTLFALNFEVGEEVFLTEIINDDYYAAGGKLHVETDVNGDLVAAGGTVIIDSTISQDLTLIGGDITLRGEVKDDVRMGGVNIKIHSTIKDDLLVGGGNIELTKESFVGGDFIFGGGNVVINGAINGDLMGVGGNVVINNTIGGNVNLHSVKSVKLGPSGKVIGNFVYRSPTESSTVNSNTVKGLIDYKSSSPVVDMDSLGAIVAGLIAGFSIYQLLSLLFIGLFYVWILRFYMVKTSEAAYGSPLKSFGIGILAFIVTPIVAVIALATGIGATLSFILMLFWILAIFLGKLVAISMIGLKLVKVKDKSCFLRAYGAFAAGVLVYVILGFIPIIGWVAKFLLVMMGIGALILYEKELFDPLRKKKLI